MVVSLALEDGEENRNELGFIVMPDVGALCTELVVLVVVTEVVFAKTLVGLLLKFPPKIDGEVVFKVPPNMFLPVSKLKVDVLNTDPPVGVA